MSRVRSHLIQCVSFSETASSFNITQIRNLHVEAGAGDCRAGIAFMDPTYLRHSKVAFAVHASKRVSADTCQSR